jgi:hypothetical protein
MEIPQGNSREDNKARKQIIKDFYASWIAEHPEKRVWNKDLHAFIYVKFQSSNETAGRASVSYESTCEVLRLSEILSDAKLIKTMPPKKDDANQKPYSEILIMRQRGAMLVVGYQKTKNEYVQYCISAKK